jgi:hypothetical protein
MTHFGPADTLYIALLCYAAGTVVALVSLFTRDKRPQFAALLLMIAGFAAHTFWIGTICVRTGHPPLTNLPEAAAFMSWTVFAVELVLYIRYRVYAASFFVYPLVFTLLAIAAVIGEPFAHLDPALRSSLFTTHIFLSTVGTAALLIGLAFTMLAFVQDRSLKSKRRGALQRLHDRSDRRGHLVVSDNGGSHGAERERGRRGRGLDLLRNPAAVVHQRFVSRAAHDLLLRRRVRLDHRCDSGHRAWLA